MKKRIIYHKPLGKQDRFIISTVYAKTKEMRRGLELCKDMHLNVVNFEQIPAEDTYNCAIACEEVALDGMFCTTEELEHFEYVTNRKASVEAERIASVPVEEENFVAEKLRRNVFHALVNGAAGIEYDSVFDGAITKDGRQGSHFRYIQDMNFRMGEIGRTLVALKLVSVYYSKDINEEGSLLSESSVLAEQELPQNCAIGEFEDSEGNRYLLIQNYDCSEKTKREFVLKLKQSFRSYRVNPHDGRQMPPKINEESQKILIMPGDADLYRYQRIEEEAYFIEYALEK